MNGEEIHSTERQARKKEKKRKIMRRDHPLIWCKQRHGSEWHGSTPPLLAATLFLAALADTVQLEVYKT